MIKESNIMKEIHRVREEFYRETKGKNREYILKLIKEDSQKVIQELENIKPDPKLIEDQWGHIFICHYFLNKNPYLCMMHLWPDPFEWTIPKSSSCKVQISSNVPLFSTAVPGAVKRGQEYLRSDGQLERVINKIIADI